MSETTLEYCRAALRRLRAFADRVRVPLGDDGNVDAALVLPYSEQNCRGHYASKGKRTLAVLMELEPEFSPLGRRRVLLVWRARRDWKRRTPTVNRRPPPWRYWGGRAIELRKASLMMATFHLMWVSGHFRPSELLSTRRYDWTAPDPEDSRS